MKAEDIIAMNRDYVFFSWSVQSQVDPILAVRSDGVYFWDADGKRYLDFSSQLMNVNIGHGNQKVIAAVQEQVAPLRPGHLHRLCHDPIEERRDIEY